MPRHGVKAEPVRPSVPSGVALDDPAAPTDPAALVHWRRLLAAPDAERWSAGDSSIVSVLAVALAELAEHPTAALISSVVALTDRLGLSPRSRAALGVVTKAPAPELVIESTGDDRRAHIMRLAIDDGALPEPLSVAVDRQRR